MIAQTSGSGERRARVRAKCLVWSINTLHTHDMMSGVSGWMDPPPDPTGKPGQASRTDLTAAGEPDEGLAAFVM